MIVSKKLSKLPRSFDARDWASEWLEVIKNYPGVPTDEGTMVGWFANALMCGFDEANRRTNKKMEKMKFKVKAYRDENKGLKNYIKVLIKKEK